MSLSKFWETIPGMYPGGGISEVSLHWVLDIHLTSLVLGHP